MHQMIQDGLEDYLSGTLDDTSKANFDGHLAQCPECRSEVAEMTALSGLFAALRVEESEAVVPAPGFYAKLTDYVEQREETSLWSLLFQPAFARQVAMASLLFLAVIGGLLISREPEAPPMPTPEMVIAAEEGLSNGVAGDEDRARGQMLVTLASYE